MSDVTFERDDYKYAKPDWVKVATICEGQRAVKAAKETYLPDPNMVGDSSDDKAAVYKAYLQRAMFFNITDNIRVGVQGVNLLNEVTRTTQAYTGDPDVLAPRSFFMNDRRFSFILRGNF